MAVTEQARHRLYQYFQETMGDDRAATMMELLPPSGWDDIATKADVAAVKAELKADVASVKADVAELKAEMERFEQRLEQRIERELVTKAEFERGMRSLLSGVIVTNMALLGLAIGAATAIVR